MEELDATTVPVWVYPGAIYLHQGESYLITHLDLDMGIAHAAPADTNYYTQPREANSLEIGQTWEKKRMPGSNAHLGELRGSQQVIGCRRLQQFSDTAFRASAEHARTGIHHGGAVVRRAASRRMSSGETRTGFCRRASRCRARGDHHPASLCHVWPAGHRGALNTIPPRHRPRPGIHLRCPSWQRGHLRERFCSPLAAMGSYSAPLASALATMDAQAASSHPGAASTTNPWTSSPPLCFCRSCWAPSRRRDTRPLIPRSARPSIERIAARGSPAATLRIARTAI